MQEVGQAIEVDEEERCVQCAAVRTAAWVMVSDGDGVMSRRDDGDGWPVHVNLYIHSIL
jgi:hypothetical protein